MKLSTYQEIARSYAGTEDQVEQIAYAVCHYYQLAPAVVNDMSKGEFLQYTASMTRLLNKIAVRPWYYRRILQTDAHTINWAQWVEIQAWLKYGDVDCLALVAASILRNRHEKSNHKRNVIRMENINVRRILYDLRVFLKSFEGLIASYAGLFEKDELPPDSTEEEIEAYEKEKALDLHPFIEQYGWQFSTKQIAKYEGITIAATYDLPITQCLNVLSYLKSESNYLKKMNK